MTWLTPTRRRWLYAIAIAGFGVLGVYGILDADEMAAWGVLAAAVCGIALGNVTDEPSDEPPAYVPQHAQEE